MASGHIYKCKNGITNQYKVDWVQFHTDRIVTTLCHSVLSVWVGQFIQKLNRGLKCERVSFGLGDRDDVCNTCVGLRCVQHSSVSMSQPRVLILPVSGTDGLTGWEKEDRLRDHKHSPPHMLPQTGSPLRKLCHNSHTCPFYCQLKSTHLRFPKIFFVKFRLKLNLA